jgi:Ca2+-binding EF-hand superfamily protein
MATNVKDAEWSVVEHLPTEKTAEHKEKRKDLFSSFDPNGNGYLSLAELDKGCLEMGVGLPKPVIMRAFQAANSIAQDNGKNRTQHGFDYIEFCEFRLFLVYLQKYLELWKVFDDIDSGDDRRISFDEFQKALPKLSEWGVQVEDAQGEFNKIDTNGGGQVLFEEFTDWGLKKALASFEESGEEL